MKIPEYVQRCLDRLEQAGFEAYIVGGCVRDHLMGNVPHDYDCCTAAEPEAMQAIFADRQLVLAGLKHGTVGVVTDSGVVEITTFRTEGGYADSRHPDWVHFVRSLREDLARRDFTVNAMAYSPRRGLSDPFGGREDLKRGLLRAVGDPEKRFREDALRILRALKFDRQIAIVAGIFQNIQAGTHRHHAMAHHRAADIIAAARGQPGAAGLVLRHTKEGAGQNLGKGSLAKASCARQ